MRFLFVALLALTSCHPRPSAAPQDHYVAQARFPAEMIEIGDFDRALLGPVQAKFDELVGRGDRLILFRLNSYGGSVFAGQDLILHVEEAKKRGVRIQCVVDHKAYSMGAVFVESVCDERLATPRSTILFHNASTQAEGTANQLREDAEFLEALNAAMSLTVAQRIGMPVDEYRARIEKRAWTMGVEEALAAGVIDAVVQPLDLPPLAELPAPDLDFGSLFQ